jgi:hypothetical protein
MTYSKISVLSGIGMAAAATVVAAVVLTGQTAFAQEAKAAVEVQQAPLTLAQAVTLAEAKANRRAIRAKLEVRSAQPVYKITLIGPGHAESHLRIAALGGRVLDTAEAAH